MEQASGHVDAPIDREATEWQEVVPSPLSLVEIESQPFSLAKSLPSVVAAQQSTFRALSSVTSALARVVSGTTAAPVESRSSPSDTSLSEARRVAPGTLSDDQGTGFADVRALAVSAGLMTAGSSLLFDLGKAVSGTTEVVLGLQAAGASFSPSSSRHANQGTSFAPSSLPPTAPSLLQSSVTGSVDSSFQTQQSPTLGLPAAPAAGTAAGSTTTLPVTREATGQSELSAQVGGVQGQAAPAASTAQPTSRATADLNAGPYAVPNGFNSVFSTAAFEAGSQLSMAVRSLAGSSPSAQLPLRSSQETASSPGGGLPLVLEQYPSTYPLGDAYAVSRITASLGLDRSGAGVPPGTAATAVGVTEEEAPGLENPSQTSGGAFLGAPLESRQVGSTASFAQGAAAGEVPSPLDAQLGAEAATEPGRAESAAIPPPRTALQAHQLFGERWLASIATAAGIGAAMIDLLTGTGAHGPGSSSRETLVNTPEGPRRYGSASTPLVPSPLEEARGLRAVQPASDAATLSRGLPAYSLGAAPAPRSAWEVATTLPGILTPLDLFGVKETGTRGALAAPGAATGASPTAGREAGQPSRPLAERPGLLELEAGSSSASSPMPPPGAPDGAPTPSPSVSDSPSGGPAPTFGSEAAPTSRPAYPDALALAASLRVALLGTSSSLIGAWRPQGTAAHADRAPGTSWLAQGESTLPAALEELKIGTTYARAPRSTSEAVEPPIPRYSNSPTSPPAGTRLQGLPTAPTGLDDLVIETAPLTSEESPEQATRPGEEAAEPGREPSTSEASPQTRFQTPLRGPLSEAYFPALLAAIAARVPLGTGTRLRVSPSQPREAGAQPAAARAATPGAPLLRIPALPTRDEPAQLARETDFFGLESVAETLSIAAALHGASQLGAVVPPPPPRVASRVRDAAPREVSKASPEQAPEPGQASRLLEGWRSAPEEAVARVISEAPASGRQPQGAQPQEADDRELRRKIERLIEEDLRRHGYQP